MIYSIFTLKSYFLLEKYYIYININNSNSNNILLLQGGGGTKRYRVVQVLLQYTAAFRY